MTRFYPRKPNAVSWQRSCSRLMSIALLVVCLQWLPLTVHAQSATATLSGTVEDQNGAIVPGVNITIQNSATSLERQTNTNDSGGFTIPLLSPGVYTITARRDGFSPVEIRNVVLNVGDQKALQIQLKAGDVNAQVTVDSTAETVRTDAAVATLVDQHLVQNIPLNGLTLQRLISLTPGIVLTPSNLSSPGQFSVNGQRTDTNQFLIDGVSANFGMNINVANGSGFAGAQPALTSAGGTNGLVSVDALEEFKVQTSTYAPEFGRTPGAQIQVLTKSGSNAFHGSLFEYFRNDVLDANDWFANRAGFKRAPLRQNDFGGTLGGPVRLPRFNGKDRLFFFFSYEGLRLRQPQTTNWVVPSPSLRASAAPAVRALLDGYPKPNGPDLSDPLTGKPSGLAQFTSSTSDSSTLNATSVRVDYHMNSRFLLFARYDESPSTAKNRTGGPSSIFVTDQGIRTMTGGINSVLSARLLNEFRVNYSKQQGLATLLNDTLNGAVIPPPTAFFPASGDPQKDSSIVQVILPGGSAVLQTGTNADNQQRQIQLADSISLTIGAHALKMGGDFRLLRPVRSFGDLKLNLFFLSQADIQNSVASFAIATLNSETRPTLHNVSLFGQDNWAVTRRLTMTCGARWDLNPPPTVRLGQEALVVTGAEPATYGLAPRGTPLYPTRYGNIAPRLGLAYRLREGSGWGATLRGGFGLFYDLGSDVALRAYNGFPFQIENDYPSVPFPLQGASAERPTLPTVITPPYPGSFFTFAEDFRIPRTWQWNATLDQEFNRARSVLTVSYVGAHGLHLLRDETRFQPNANFRGNVHVIRTDATSDYDALQTQYSYRLTRGLQGFAGYTWSHAIDDGSDSLTFSILRGAADFDFRHVLSAAFVYDLPRPHVFKRVLGGWSLSGLGRWQSAPPVNVTAASSANFGGLISQVRPNLLPGVPIYIYDHNLPGGKAINFHVDPSRPGCVGPFCKPPAGTQGSLGRNVIRGFGAWQVDLALKRTFTVSEQVKFSLSLEAFNIFNHPNFGQPNGNITNSLFGRPATMLSRDLGGVSPLYQIGGPRSMQLSARIQF